MEAFACKTKKATKNEYKVAHLGRRNSFLKNKLNINLHKFNTYSM